MYSCNNKLQGEESKMGITSSFCLLEKPSATWAIKALQKQIESITTLWLCDSSVFLFFRVIAKLSQGRRSTISVASNLLKAWLRNEGQSCTWHEVSTSRPCLSNSRKAAIAPCLRSAFSGVCGMPNSSKVQAGASSSRESSIQRYCTTNFIMI